MNTIDRLTDSSTALVQQARNVLQSANLPQWLETGAVLGVAKSGTRAATTLARRNPGVALAIGVVGAGVLAYRFYRKRAAAKIDVNATSHAKGRGKGTDIEGEAVDVQHKRGRKSGTQRVKPSAA